MTADVAVVIAAGGAGRRAGGVKKQYRLLAGQPLLGRALQPFLDHPAVGWVVVALPAEDAASPPSWLSTADQRVGVVAGGGERADSVRNALAALTAKAETVLVHDAARPLVSREVIDRVLAVARSGIGAVAAIPVADTIKEVGDERRIVATPERQHLWQAQTPQGFPTPMIVEAHRLAEEEGVTGTDDAALVERYGGTVVVVDGDPENLKVTRPTDFEFAELILRRRGREA